jgi:hypothetical protein
MAAFACVTIGNFVTHDLSFYYDAYSYIQTSQRNILSLDILFGWRHPVIPVIYKLLQRDIVAIALFQAMLYIAAWIFLALVACGIAKSSGLKLLTVFSLLFIGLIPEFLIWNNIILSESISMSLFIIFSGFLLLFHRSESKAALGGILISATLLAFNKDIGSYIVLLYSAYYFAAYVVGKAKRWQTLLVGGFFVLLFVMASFTSEHLRNVYDENSIPIEKRYQVPLLNIYKFRVLSDPWTTGIFKNYGMPYSDDLQITQTDEKWDVLLFQEDKFSAFSAWVLRNGKRYYARFLLLHPLHSLATVIGDIDKIFLLSAKSGIFKYAAAPKKKNGWRFKIDHSYPNRSYHRARNRKELLAALRIRGIFHSILPLGPILAFLAAGMILLLFFNFRLRVLDHDAAFFPVFLLVAVSHLLLSFFGDAIEIERHCSGALLHLLVALVLFNVDLLGNIVERKNGSP